MKKTFDFNQVGKKMPYQVPDGFFAQMEEKVMTEIRSEQQTPQEDQSTQEGQNKKIVMKVMLRATLSAAAVVALFFIIRNNMPINETQTDSFAKVELAYDKLTTEDQEFLLQIYEEDPFINENNIVEL